MNRLIDIFSRSDGSRWHFLAGVVLALGGNVLIAGLAPAPHPSNFIQLLMTGILLFGASGFFTTTGWLLNRLDQLARNQSRGSAEEHTVGKKRLVAASIKILIIYAIAGFLLTLSAFALLSSFKGENVSNNIGNILQR